MSDDIEVVKRPGITIGGLGITYQATLAEGRTIAFEQAIDATTDVADLDRMLDNIHHAVVRQQAINELPLVRDALSFETAKLPKLRRQRAGIVAAQQARHSAMNVGRRNPKPLEAGGPDANLMQIDQTIEASETRIRVAKARIPYLEAIIDRRAPPDPFPYALDEDAAAAA